METNASGYDAAVMTEGDLEGLIRLTAEGHSEAAEELARRVEGPVRAAVRPRLGPELRMRVETEDILQSTIVASLRDLSGFEYRGEQAFLAWLARVAEHRIRYAARFHRAAKRDLRRDRPLAAAARVAGQGTSPSQAASRTEVTVGLHRAVERLPDPSGAW